MRYRVFGGPYDEHLVQRRDVSRDQMEEGEIA